jgi:hypothetical protein
MLQYVNSAREMFFFLHGPGDSSGKVVAVFFGFFDGSNTHAGAKVWTLCGWLGEEAAFTALDDAWKKVLNRPQWPTRINRFHMVDCVHGEEEFSRWSFAERLAIFGELCSVIMNVSLIGVSSAVITEDFPKLEPEELELLNSEGLGTPLDLSLQSVFQRCVRLTRNTSEEEQISLLFDYENTGNRTRILEFSDLYRGKFGFGKWLAGIGFGESVRFTPLQAADILAYCTYRFSMLRYPEIPIPDFRVLPGFERLVRATLHENKGGFDLDSMKQLAAKIRERHSKGDTLRNDEPNAKGQTA